MLSTYTLSKSNLIGKLILTYTIFFNIPLFADVNQSGTIERKDFELAIEVINLIYL